MNQCLANQSLFKLYDKDGKGYIDANDLRRVAQITGIDLSKQEISEMMDYNIVPGQAQFD